jgi:2-hydroxy-3-oxopropionate reductase
LSLALAGAKEVGVSLPQTASAAQLMNACVATGWGQLDHSALVKPLEHLAAHEIASK